MGKAARIGPGTASPVSSSGYEHLDWLDHNPAEGFSLHPSDGVQAR